LIARPRKGSKRRLSLLRTSTVLILCSDKSEVVAKYSVLSGGSNEQGSEKEIFLVSSIALLYQYVKWCRRTDTPRVVSRQTGSFLSGSEASPEPMGQKGKRHEDSSCPRYLNNNILRKQLAQDFKDQLTIGIILLFKENT